MNEETLFAQKPKLFGRWDYDEVKVNDQCFQNYVAINTDKTNVYIPHTAGRYQLKRFRKAACPIVERFIGSISFHGRNTGKKVKAIRIMKQVLELIHLQTDENPVQVLVDAICNAGPREDSTKIGSGGSAKRQAVDVSSFRRLSQAMYFITHYAREKAFKNSKNIVETLADEIIKTAKNDPNSSSLRKREEIEKNSKANR